MSTRTSALLIDDDTRLGQLLREYLGQHAIDLTIAADGGRGQSLARQIAVAHGGSLTLGPAATTDGRETGCRATLRVAIDPAILRA